MLATSSTIKSLIQNKCKPTELDILNKFVALLDTYKINYVTLGKEQQPHFVVSNLARSKGLDSVDFSKNYFDTNKQCTLGGIFKLIKGEELAKFKLAWKESNGWGFTKANSLWITDWLGAFNYLTVGSTQQAKDFKEIGANSVERVVSNVTSNVIPLHPTKSHLTVVPPSEEQLHDAICSLAAYTNRHFKREQIVVNSFTDQSARTRRFDLVEKSGRSVKIMELKAHPLTTDHIKEAIGDKGYLELAIAKYPTKRVKMYFVAPSITKSAERLLARMTKVEFLSLGNLVADLVGEIRTEFKDNDSEWYLTKEILPKFAGVLPVQNLLKAS
jgi:hypothetical protein